MLDGTVQPELEQEVGLAGQEAGYIQLARRRGEDSQAPDSTRSPWGGSGRTEGR